MLQLFVKCVFKVVQTSIPKKIYTEVLLFFIVAQIFVCFCFSVNDFHFGLCIIAFLNALFIKKVVVESSYPFSERCMSSKIFKKRFEIGIFCNNVIFEAIVKFFLEDEVL